MLTSAELEAMQARCAAASPGPWRAFVEGGDHHGGDDFIQVSMDDAEPDMYVSRAWSGGMRPASSQDLDFIAAARQDLPALIDEVRRLRTANDEAGRGSEDGPLGPPAAGAAGAPAEPAR
jgi:hypothetical protein